MSASAQAVGLCTSTTLFNFTDIFASAVALTNTYLYADAYNPQYYAEFMPAVGLDPSDVTGFEDLMYSPSSGVDVEMDNLLELIYQNYRPSTDPGAPPGICEN